MEGADSNSLKSVRLIEPATLLCWLDRGDSVIAAGTDVNRRVEKTRARQFSRIHRSGDLRWHR